MEKLAKAFAIFLFGAVMHQTAPLIDALPQGWGALTRSAIGVLMGWPAVLAWVNDYEDVPNPYTRSTLRFFSGFVPLGVGVVAAYILQHFMSQQERNK